MRDESVLRAVCRLMLLGIGSLCFACTLGLEYYPSTYKDAGAPSDAATCAEDDAAGIRVYLTACEGGVSRPSALALSLPMTTVSCTPAPAWVDPGLRILYAPEPNVVPGSVLRVALVDKETRRPDRMWAFEVDSSARTIPLETGLLRSCKQYAVLGYLDVPAPALDGGPPRSTYVCDPEERRWRGDVVVHAPSVPTEFRFESATVSEESCECFPISGDVNGDYCVTFFDIDPVRAGYMGQLALDARLDTDYDGDLVCDQGDIDGYVAIVTMGTRCASGCAVTCEY